MTPAFIASLMNLAAEILELSSRKGTDPVDAIEALRVGLREAVKESAQAEADAKFGRS